MLSELIFIFFFELMASECFQNLKGLTTETDTDQFIEYLEDATSRGLISHQELQRLLNESTMMNPIDIEDTYSNISKLIIYETIESMLSKSLDHAKIIDWAISFLENQKDHTALVQKTVISTKKTYYPSVFKRIDAGTLIINNEKVLKNLVKFKKNSNFSITLTHPIKIDTRTITVGHWKEIMGDYPKSLSNHEHLITHRQVDIDTENISYEEQLNYPCEVTFYSALSFANKLSELHGLPPVYDLDDTTYGFYNSLKDGSLALKDKKEILKIIPISDYYNQDGYRLPTAAEQLYLKHIAKTKDQKIWYQELLAALSLFEQYKLDQSVSKKDAQQLLWNTLNYIYNFYSDNMPIQYQDLSASKPLFINGSTFYGLFSDFWEWGFDGAFSITNTSNIDPIFYNSLTKKIQRIVSGFHYYSEYFSPLDLDQSDDFYRMRIVLDFMRPNSYAAFRPVRTLK